MGLVQGAGEGTGLSLTRRSASPFCRAVSGLPQVAPRARDLCDALRSPHPSGDRQRAGQEVCDGASGVAVVGRVLSGRLFLCFMDPVRSFG